VAYDIGGNVTQRTDTAGRVTSYAYDNLNRMSSTSDADNKTTSFQYDALSRTTAVVDALNQQYGFSYDALGRRTQMTRAGVSMSYVYDAVGNRTRRTDYNGTVTNYTYDDLNRLTTITYPNAITTTYGYDAVSQLTSATNANGTAVLGYDNRGRIAGTTDVFNQTIGYSYDANGNRTGMILNGSAYATYTHDAVNRLTNLADSANQNFPHTYDAVNRLTARSAPNGVTSNYAYDGLNRLTALNHVAGAITLIGNQYSYNNANNIASWSNTSGNHAYGYDLVDRLTAATNSAQPNENYGYDAVGNRATSHLSAGYSYQPFNKLTSTSTTNYTYDNNGNLLSKTDSLGTMTFTWNEENQLTQVSLPGGLTVNYKYDGLGRRIQRTTTAGGNERYIYDGQNILIDLNADSSVATTYLNGPGIDNQLRQTSATTGVSYYLTDQVGSTAALTNTSGNIVELLAYDSFGNSSGSSLTRYTYTGRELDPDTGLMYYRARFYDPQVGRFVSEDPAGLSPGINPYVYVGNDPIQWSDPSGLCRCGLKTGPEYYVSTVWGGGSVGIGGTSVPKGTKFHWHAEFLNDATHDPKCCEVRQLISWNRGPFGQNTVPHAGFPPWAQPGTWLEDRNEFNKRYGRRTGPYAQPSLNDITGNEYHSDDQPNGTGTVPGFAFRFRLIVVDVCQGGKRIFTSKTITVNF
jgi:RHS repeat-associated protein